MLSAQMEKTLSGDKSTVLKLIISRLIVEYYEKKFRSSLCSLYRLDEAKKPSYSSIPLSCLFTKAPDGACMYCTMHTIFLH